MSDPIMAPVAAGPEPAAPSVVPDAGKIRLKPRLNAGAAGLDQAAPEPISRFSPPVAEPSGTVAEAPPSASPGSGLLAQENGMVASSPAPALRVRLQPRPSSTENPSAPAAVKPAPAPEGAAMPAVHATGATPPKITAPAGVTGAADAVDTTRFKLKPAGSPASAPLMIGGLPVSSKPPVGAAPAASGAPKLSPPPPGKRAGRGRKPLIVLLVIVGLGAGGYYGVTYFGGLPQADPTPVAAQSPVPPPAKAEGGANTPSETLNKLASAPAEMIQKAKEAITARRGSEQSRVDASLAGESPDQPAPGVKPAVETVSTRTAAAPTATRSVAPGLTASVKIEAAAEASAALREFVANARISGVGATRVLINDRLVRAGDMVDESLGIRFDGYIRDTKQLRFSDRSGAHVVRRY